MTSDPVPDVAAGAYKPSGIVVDLEQRLLQITWNDGATSVYTFDTLRRACPCAECRPWVHGVGRVGDTPPHVLEAVGELTSLEDISPVGGYALHFNWADGHVFGIYDWRYLRALDENLSHTD